MTTPEPPATLLARRMITELRAGGVRHVVLAPGSRSAPLAYALAAAADAGWLRLHVRIDERVAGFVALGLARAAREPVAVVTTSGTAVANLHPAVLEASHSGVPLILVTADRPHEMRSTGANQTTDQVGIFGRACRWQADVPAGTEPDAVAQVVVRALAAATGARSGDPGPVHLNVALRDPLVPAAPWQAGPPPATRVVATHRPPPAAVDVPAGGHVVVVAGDGAGPEAARLAEAGGWPLLAEPSSGARHGDAVVDAYRTVLARLGGQVERVLVLGHPTLSRPVSALLAREDVEITVVAPTGAVWPDVAGNARQVVGGIRVVPGASDGSWLWRWVDAGRVAAGVITEHAAATFDGLTVARLVAAAPAPEVLVVGSSMAIRDLDLAAPAWPSPSPDVVANRGLAGIDGTIATATGIALARRMPVRAVIGDLTFLHDAGGLLRGDLEEEVDLQVVVLNDHGGTIFATLEHGAPERAATFERVFGTPQHADLGALSAGYGAAHRLVRTAVELEVALAEPITGRSVVEVVLDHRDVREVRAALSERIQAQLTGADG
ncbi:2-succinyl-5-enolpyruvyl-6-hydroxy-3-cyclohexene-1-carboxylic-acid synthase [Georgenia sp. MJ170]|uniref:2-succinyl-5-enolpyruvyl-6-hydroxy-3- cyclohexene-1-carboxylic-acid synthase n=1 Tax=Georgenia sunbinii TaxID=3117728 RepID=UPI002F26156F